MDDLQNDGLALGVFEAFDRSGQGSLVLDECVTKENRGNIFIEWS